MSKDCNKCTYFDEIVDTFDCLIGFCMYHDMEISGESTCNNWAKDE